MKSLRESLLDDDLIDKTDKIIKDDIEAFLKENFKGASSCKISRTPNKDGKYEVSSTKDIEVRNKKITSLTNGTFVWTIVNGFFIIRFCNSLKSLEGAPKEIGRNFYCSGCDSLTSLEGAPKKVRGSFYCSFCDSLTSLEGAPKEVGRSFECTDCKTKFTEEDVRKVSNVEGNILC